jgi:tetratricopeptide (TPR) repeat protein
LINSPERLAMAANYSLGYQLGVTSVLLIVVATLSGAELVPGSNRDATAPKAPPLPRTEAEARIEQEYQKLQKVDDTAQAEVEKLTSDNAVERARGAGLSDEELEHRIKDRLAPVRKAYEDFLKRHPNHAQAHLTYGCFLNDRQDETGAKEEWEKALDLDPRNPDVYNNLAGSYSEVGPASKAFEFYTKAIDLNPNQPLYYHNFASTMYVLRSRAMTHYGINEQQVFARIIELYSNSVRLAPTNFTYASDLAQTFYSMRPFPADGAANAWSNALRTARGPANREEAYLQLSRVNMIAGHLREARVLLNEVNGPEHSLAKSNLLQNITAREASAPASADRPAGL